MIGYGKQSIDDSDIRAVTEVLKSDFLTQGPKAVEFEQKLAVYTKAKYAVVIPNGTCGLHLAYLAAKFKKGDEVITTPNTFVSTSNMLLALGVKPVFCDISLDDYNINEEEIEKLITGRTKAIVPVHFAGQSCQMDKIYKVAKKYGLLVIEDAAHGLGGEYKRNKIGSCHYSDMAVVSFHPVKSITTGEGGAVLTNNIKLYKKLKLLANHGIQKDKKGFNVMTNLGYNYRMTDIQAALGTSQLKRIDVFIKKRRAVVKQYAKELARFDKITLPKELSDRMSAWHIYVIRVKSKKDRLSLYKYLIRNGVGVNFHYPAIYSHPYYRKHGFKNVKLKNMEEYHTTAITLPCHTLLTTKEIRYISNKIKEYYERH